MGKSEGKNALSNITRGVIVLPLLRTLLPVPLLIQNWCTPFSSLSHSFDKI